MDSAHRAQDDFLGVQGFLLAVRDVLRIKRGGLFWAGHPCNPLLDLAKHILVSFRHTCSQPNCLAALRFVWISAGTHWRHISILGDDRSFQQTKVLSHRLKG